MKKITNTFRHRFERLVILIFNTWLYSGMTLFVFSLTLYAQIPLFMLIVGEYEWYWVLMALHSLTSIIYALWDERRCRPLI